MSLLKKIFRRTEAANKRIEFNWQFLNAIEQIETLIENSETKPQIIFKYSTRCGISRLVLKKFERDNQELENYFDFYFNDLIKYRQVSNLIASQFNIRHESPQLIVIRRGEVILHSSHGSINAIDLKELIV